MKEGRRSVARRPSVDGTAKKLDAAYAESRVNKIQNSEINVDSMFSFRHSNVIMIRPLVAHAEP